MAQVDVVQVVVQPQEERPYEDLEHFGILVILGRELVFAVGEFRIGESFVPGIGGADFGQDFLFPHAFGDAVVDLFVLELVLLVFLEESHLNSDLLLGARQIDLVHVQNSLPCRIRGQQHRAQEVRDDDFLRKQILHSLTEDVNCHQLVHEKGAPADSQPRDRAHVLLLRVAPKPRLRTHPLVIHRRCVQTVSQRAFGFASDGLVVIDLLEELLRGFPPVLDEAVEGIIDSPRRPGEWLTEQGRDRGGFRDENHSLGQDCQHQGGCGVEELVTQAEVGLCHEELATRGCVFRFEVLLQITDFGRAGAVELFVL
ncbi:hypothetical protein Mapa_006196 [Marchantia paleacea]|nr:hypothetical protein Mapa_006196 [Marchantia paleacea]